MVGFGCNLVGETDEYTGDSFVFQYRIIYASIRLRNKEIIDDQARFIVGHCNGKRDEAVLYALVICQSVNSCLIFSCAFRHQYDSVIVVVK